MNFCFQTTYNESFFFQKRNNWKKKKKILPLPFFLFGQNKTMTLFCVAVIANDDQKPTFSGDSRFSVFSHSSTQTKRHDFFIAKLDDAREEKCYWHWALLNALIRRENTLRETTKKSSVLFILFCLIYGWIRSNGKRPMDVVSSLARGSEIMSYENSAVYFVNLASVSKY